MADTITTIVHENWNTMVLWRRFDYKHLKPEKVPKRSE